MNKIELDPRLERVIRKFIRDFNYGKNISFCIFWPEDIPCYYVKKSRSAAFIISNKISCRKNIKKCDNWCSKAQTNTIYLNQKYVVISIINAKNGEIIDDRLKSYIAHEIGHLNTGICATGKINEYKAQMWAIHRSEKLKLHSVKRSLEEAIGLHWLEMRNPYKGASQMYYQNKK